MIDSDAFVLLNLGTGFRFLSSMTGNISSRELADAALVSLVRFDCSQDEASRNGDALFVPVPDEGLVTLGDGEIGGVVS